MFRWDFNPFECALLKRRACVDWKAARFQPPPWWLSCYFGLPFLPVMGMTQQIMHKFKTQKKMLFLLSSWNFFLLWIPQISYFSKSFKRAVQRDILLLIHSFHLCIGSYFPKCFFRDMQVSLITSLSGTFRFFKKMKLFSP